LKLLHRLKKSDTVAGPMPALPQSIMHSRNKSPIDPEESPRNAMAYITRTFTSSVGETLIKTKSSRG
jgi:hypothetical protein